MAFSRKALKARAKVRKDAAAGSGYLQIMKEGERAFLRRLGKDANPYQSGTDEHEIWLEGYVDASETNY